MGIGRTEYISVPYEKTVTITENKVPTDDSVKLLIEIEEKMLKRLLGKHVLDLNNFKAVSFFSIIQYVLMK